jgi:serine/threonine-protein kinase
VSPALDDVVLRCLEKEPAKRFASAADLLDALRAAIESTHEGKTETAVGVYLEVDVEGGDGDEARLDDFANVIDAIESWLAESGLLVPYRTSNGMLGVRGVEPTDDVEAVRAEMEVAVRRLGDTLAQRPNPHADVRVFVSLSPGQVVGRRSAHRLQIVGGSLLNVSAWKGATRTRVG